MTCGASSCCTLGEHHASLTHPMCAGRDVCTHAQTHVYSPTHISHPNKHTPHTCTHTHTHTCPASPILCSTHACAYLARQSAFQHRRPLFLGGALCIACCSPLTCGRAHARWGLVVRGDGAWQRDERSLSDQLLCRPVSVLKVPVQVAADPRMCCAFRLC